MISCLRRKKSQPSMKCSSKSRLQIPSFTPEVDVQIFRPSEAARARNQTGTWASGVHFGNPSAAVRRVSDRQARDVDKGVNNKFLWITHSRLEVLSSIGSPKVGGIALMIGSISTVVGNILHPFPGGITGPEGESTRNYVITNTEDAQGWVHHIDIYLSRYLHLQRDHRLDSGPSSAHDPGSRRSPCR